jgi:hypothetical protein
MPYGVLKVRNAGGTLWISNKEAYVSKRCLETLGNR